MFKTKREEEEITQPRKKARTDDLLLHTILINFHLKEKEFRPYLIPIEKMPPLLLESMMRFQGQTRIYIDVERDDAEMEMAQAFIYLTLPYLDIGIKLSFSCALVNCEEKYRMENYQPDTLQVHRAFLRKAYENVTKLSCKTEIDEADCAEREFIESELKQGRMYDVDEPDETDDDNIWKCSRIYSNIVSTEVKKKRFPNHNPDFVVIDHVFMFEVDQMDETE